MTGLHENSKDQLAEADVHWVYVVNLLPSRPPSFSPSFRTRRAILNPRSAIVAVNVDFCPVPTTDIVEQAPSTLLPRRASIMNRKKELLRAIGMENIPFTCVTQVYILRRRPTRVDKTGHNSTTKRPTDSNLAAVLQRLVRFDRVVDRVPIVTGDD